METMNASAQQEKTIYPQPICPACGAPLILLRGSYRCFRCCYSACESCETEAEDEE
jgi:competence CoiA-like predicted nuclease